MPIFHIITGLTLLLFGRKLFWLFVAFSGLMVGFQLSEMMIPHHSQWVQLSIAIGVGIAGALVAILAQRIAFVFAGFFAGIFVVLMGMEFFGDNDVSGLWFVAGGAVGALAGFLYIDQAIVILSSMIGAVMVVTAFRLPPVVTMIFFIILSTVGASIQIRLMDKAENPDLA